jgi:ubiquitin thioesterase protein OTUB1
MCPLIECCPLIRPCNIIKGLLDDAIPKRDLIGSVEPMSALREEYERGSGGFVAQIDHLIKSGYTGVRRSRGDGNCFYRCAYYVASVTIIKAKIRAAALAFAYVERLLRAEDEELAAVSALSTLESCAPLLEAAGFQKIVYEDFYEALTGLIHQVYTPPVLNTTTLLKEFQSDEGTNIPSAAFRSF